jgi:hypothetical protein
MQDDNRIVADHVDYKLACIGFTAGPVSGDAAHFSENEVEALAAVEHGRWAAGRYLEGWSYAGSRNDTKDLHPSLVSYADLPETEKQKDRAVVTIIPRLLGMVSQSLRREFRGGVLIESKGMTASVAEDIAERYAQWQARSPGHHLLAALALEDASHIALAEALSARRIALEIVQHEPVFLAFKTPSDLDLARRAAATLRQAHRVAIAQEPASDHIRKHANELVIVRDCSERVPELRAALFDSEEMIHAGWLA